MPNSLRGIMFTNTAGDPSHNLGLGDGALANLAGGAYNVAVGYNTLQTTTGSSNIAIGSDISHNYSNTITINASEYPFTPNINDSACFVAPIRKASTANALYYNSMTHEITWDASGGGADSSSRMASIAWPRLTGIGRSSGS